MSQQVLTITEINEYIRAQMDNDCLLRNVAVIGEISNYKIYPSGHHYFTLKDDGGTLKCVMFRGNAIRLRFKPEHGMQIIAMGKISVYPRDGAYQLYCTALAQNGVGDLHAAFEQMKAKLSAQGLFDPAHKKALPPYPGVIGIVTSSAGAAVHDMLRIIRKRYPLTKVLLLPVRVQGAEAPGEIAIAIKYANKYNLCDVLIVGRGGGSLEDLWAFNEEIVARAIYDSAIPVISAVGHEPDVTISDYVADLRAATPSNAAELVVPDKDAIRQNLDAVCATMIGSIERQIKNARRHLNLLSSSGPMQGPTAYINQRKNMLETIANRLIQAQERIVSQKRHRFVESTAKLDAMSPLKVLTRGYALTTTDKGVVLRSVRQVEIGQKIQISMGDGKIGATVMDIKEGL